uniref:Uncharacterized protein n=1 Tax=Paramormyrops kingsleyae TaxID=1676925 RepID=A0A3B3RAK8_9TELE
MTLAKPLMGTRQVRSGWGTCSALRHPPHGKTPRDPGFSEKDFNSMREAGIFESVKPSDKESSVCSSWSEPVPAL